MLPVRLELKGFTSYRQRAVLDFTRFRVACLSGPNGAGKSSLLDAIVWALWGQARSDRDDHVIAWDADRCEVTFDFTLDHTSFYRVRRTRIVKASKNIKAPAPDRPRETEGRLALLLASTPEDYRTGNFKDISAGTISETQQKINALIGFSQEAFVNSVYLRQGRADEFMSKSPIERKEVLMDILGLSEWATYLELAKEQLRQTESEIQGTIREREWLESEVQRLDHYRHSLEQAIQAEAAARAQRDALYERLSRMPYLPVRIKELETQIQQQEREIQLTKQDQEELERRRAHVEQRLRALQQVLADAERIREGYQQLEHARTQAQMLSNALQHVQPLLEEEQRLLHERSKIISFAEAELRAKLSEADNVQQRVASLSKFEDELRALQTNIQALEQEWQNVTALHEKIEQKQAALAEWRARVERAAQRVTLLNANLEELANQDICPLCGSALTPEHREQVRHDLLHERDQMLAEQRDAQSRLAMIEAEIQRESETAHRLRQRLEPEMRRTHARHEFLLSKLDELAKERQRLEHLRTECATKAQAIRAGEPTRKVDALLEQVRKRIAQAGFDREALARWTQTIQSLEPFAQAYLDLVVAEREMQSLREELTDINQRIARLCQRIEHLSARLAELKTEHHTALAQKEEFETLRQAHLQAHEAWQKAQAEIARCQQGIAAAEASRARIEAINKRLAELAEQKSDLEILCSAFSPHGIPTHIIQRILPHIEDQVNLILGKLSDSALQVRLTTNYITQKGKSRETLDISVVDNNGVRPYETFSGGERFRIDFALRIALSRIVAHLHRAHLQMLFIDEGFGTQDSDGRQKIVDTVLAVQDEFACIIVVTHIDDVQQAFPFRIQVMRTPEGSVLQMEDDENVKAYLQKQKTTLRLPSQMSMAV